MKKYTDIVKEYVKRLSDDDLKFLNGRLSQRLGGDVGDAVDLMQRSEEMDRWLATSDSADDLFDMVDQVDNFVQQESKKRFTHEQKEKSKASAK